MNETINNEIEMNEIETAAESVLDNFIPLEYDVAIDETGDEGNLGAVIFGFGALAAAAIGGIAYAKKKKKDNGSKEGFFKKTAIKYLTKHGYTVNKDESAEIENEDDDLYNGLVPDKK